MLIEPPLERLLPKAENRYVLTMLTAKRARQLTDGANPMVASETPNFVSLAAEEIDADEVVYRKGKLEPFVPLRPEIEAARLQAAREADEKRAQELLEETRRLVDVDEQTLVRAIHAFDDDTFSSMDADELARQFTRFIDQTERDQEAEASAETSALEPVVNALFAGLADDDFADDELADEEETIVSQDEPSATPDSEDEATL